jgi:hypothetical protein
MMRRTDVVGRLVQVRVGCGAFGSDVFFLRMPDGGLQTFSNEWLRPTNADIPADPADALDVTYTILGEWPEVGFVVEQPKQPKQGGSFTMLIKQNT